ncbi:PLP-dependent transferase, partial [Mesorhizobium sp. M1C.F.Ca.ET.188.01.1.1]|uniref:PLP-dependent transferase n=1 Tax=Mesorhizobium sp. M1C.F.Ca.ET.188.01.1.1 TaxID=2563924 RepID=UPI00113438F5
KDLVEKIRSRTGVYLGASLSAQNAWLIMRGIDTLFPRLRTMSASAMQIARFLAKHPKIRSVTYPGLESHPQRALATRQMDVFGGVLTFQTDAPQAMAAQLADRLRVAHYAF